MEAILFTGHGAVDAAIKGLKYSALDYLLKPVYFDELTTKLEAAGNQKDEHAGRLRSVEDRAPMRRNRRLFIRD